MTDQYTKHGTPWPSAGHLPPPLPSPPQNYPAAPRRPKRGLIAATIVGAAVIALASAGIGGIIGNHIAAGSTAQSPQPAATPPPPTAQQVHAATVDLCTRYVAADRAVPYPQNSGRDLIPSYIYVSTALNETPQADHAIRDAVIKALKFDQDQIAHFSHEPAAGAIQPPVEWSSAEATAASQKVWDLCKGYGK